MNMILFLASIIFGVALCAGILYYNKSYAKILAARDYYRRLERERK